PRDRPPGSGGHVAGILVTTLSRCSNELLVPAGGSARRGFSLASNGNLLGGTRRCPPSTEHPPGTGEHLIVALDFVALAREIGRRIHLNRGGRFRSRPAAA